MSEDEAPTFSQQEDYDPLPRPLKLEELPDEARTAIWNVLFGYMKRSSDEYQAARIDWEDIDPDYLRQGEGPIDPWNVILRDVHVRHDKLALDDWYTSPDESTPMRARLMEDPFNRVFDLILFIMRHADCPPEFTTDLSDVFRRFKLAYIIDSGPPTTIFPATTAEEGNALRRSLAELRAAGLDGCAAHLRNASKCINDGDAAGSVRESIHAVESVAKKIAPKANTLSRALPALTKLGGPHHSQFVTALGNLYNYASGEDGIRHGLSEAEANVTIDEALFMLGTCASFASYLWRKHKAATAP